MEFNNYNWWKKIISTTEKAIAVKALHSIPTQAEILEHNGIPFIIRVVNNLAKKEKKKVQKKQKNFNPFLPPEKDLLIGDINEKHLAILNKFNVVDYHLLIITREFESQKDLLNRDDFLALWTILQEVEGLGFYNGGTLAGASQPHKHLQLIPYPFCSELPKIPLESLIVKLPKKSTIITLKELPFLHGISLFESFNNYSLSELAEMSLTNYLALLEAVKIDIKNNQPTQDYNLLITRDWMMMIPRCQEKFDSISINSLGFAGALLVKNEVDLAKIKQYQPIEILKQVAVHN